MNRRLALLAIVPLMLFGLTGCPKNNKGRVTIVNQSARVVYVEAIGAPFTEYVDVRSSRTFRPVRRVPRAGIVYDLIASRIVSTAVGPLDFPNIVFGLPGVQLNRNAETVITFPADDLAPPVVSYRR